jgi:hypothetical protein
MISDKHYQCNRCGGSLATNYDKATCTLPAPYRASGICGGLISTEISRKQYRKATSRWRTEIRKKKIEKIMGDIKKIDLLN